MSALANVPPEVKAALASMEQADMLLDGVLTLDAAKAIADKHKTLDYFIEQRTKNTSILAKADRLVQRANRKLGELYRALPTASGRRTDLEAADGVELCNSQLQGPTKSEELKRLNVSRMEANRCEKLADLTEEEFEKRQAERTARLEKASRDPGSMTATSAASDHDGDVWGTPEFWAELAREFFGGEIDLDPASNDRAQQIIRANRYFTKADDALSKRWEATSVWLNPPYSKPLCGKFSGHFFDDHRDKAFAEGLQLVNNPTEVEWFQDALERCTAVLFPKGRIGFIGADGKPVTNNNQGQAIFYVGAKLPRFYKLYKPHGQILIGYKR